MHQELGILYLTAATLGFIHTLLGPDHYLPFIALAKAGKWSLAKTGWVTFVCGLGHIISSVVLGLVGIFLGISLGKLKVFEALRGNIAGWALLAFGLAYFIWGFRIMLKNKPHRHFHGHADQDAHEHQHTHATSHLHLHSQTGKRQLTPWILFIIFILGPCEPLIPVLMYPAAKFNLAVAMGVALIFGGVTLVTMLGVVTVVSRGINFLPLKKFERYAHVSAGAAILLCGAAIQIWGL